MTFPRLCEYEAKQLPQAGQRKFGHDSCNLGKGLLAKPCSEFQALTSAWSVDGDGDLLLDPARVLPQLALRPVRVAVAPAHRLTNEWKGTIG